MKPGLTLGSIRHTHCWAVTSSVALRFPSCWCPESHQVRSVAQISILTEKLFKCRFQEGRRRLRFCFAPSPWWVHFSKLCYCCEAVREKEPLLSNNISKLLLPAFIVLSNSQLFSYLIFVTPWEVGIISCLFYRRRNWGTCLSHSAGDWQSWGRAGVLPRSFCSHGTCLTLKLPGSTDWFDLGLALPEPVQKSKTVTFLLAQSPSPSGHRAKSWVGLGNKPRSHFQ